MASRLADALEKAEGEVRAVTASQDHLLVTVQRALRETIQRAEAAEKRAADAEDAVARADRHVVEYSPYLRYSKCGQCSGGSYVVPGFECPYHAAARRLAAGGKGEV